MENISDISDTIYFPTTRFSLEMVVLQEYFHIFLHIHVSQLKMRIL